MIKCLSRLLRVGLVASALCSVTASVAQQPTAPLTPEQFLGYPLGSRFTPHESLLRYVAHLAQQAPDRLRIQPYGKTYEGRPLEVVQVASARNLQRLDDIRHRNLQLTGIEKGNATPSADQPAVVWLSYNIHGNEAVSSEAVMRVLYDLSNPQNQEAQQWLERVVLLIDPCVNPDGHERYVQWYGQKAGAPTNASPLSWEHREAWPGGRYNHYLFDLNRDWAWQTQQESRQRVALYNQWLPQVHADFHEMSVDDPYYFSPAAKPYHEDITAWQRTFQNTIGEYNRKVFDQNNWLYFTRETYDLFYPSYGDTWPSFNGAIGMTYEQGGSGRAGVRVTKSDGDTLTLSQRIAHHHAASLATIRAAADNQTQLLKEFGKYYTDARTKPHGRYKTFVVSGAADQLRPLTEYLRQQQIEFGYAGKQRKLRGYNYATGKDEALTIKSTDVVVSMYQPKSTLVKVLFEPSPALEDSLTYDITAWALPYAYGLQGYALTSQLPAANAQVPDRSADPKLATANAQLATDKPYAYVARWNSPRDARLLSALLQRRMRVRVAQKAFEASKQQFQPGTLVIPRTGNEALGPRFDALVRALADSVGAELTAVQTGFSTTGADIGSGYVRSVGRPNVAVVAGNGISPTAFGEIWHFFEQQLGYPISVIGTDYFAAVPLGKFDVLILPDGDYGDLLTDKQLENVKTWVRGGGRLIALEGAMSYLAGKKDFALKVKPADSARAKKADPYRLLRRYADAEREALGERVQGSVYRVQLDNSHPLAFGYGSSYYALVRDPLNYQFLGEGSWNVGVLRKNEYTAGFAGSRARRKLSDTVVLANQEMGRGQVIYLADNPLFRGFWQAGKLLFTNAVFFVGQ
ncbi:zinc carboxypeptidase [Hymenobacter busanensis]|uniref:Zinc carboxypeptidase n=1 Tax=Hymenobacter busanensis TaxID=2607656 RepID=A0A7L5A1Y8_9BACT|nr:M14 family metallopeptidase [Hymenobacter busanensis]KAA9338279.1 zinc carboxypeptidase [Hymenobacter busanensis]QHJ09297.1 zinc carboxypeptidase [Hymenobacter busanensis]